MFLFQRVSAVILAAGILFPAIGQETPLEVLREAQEARSRITESLSDRIEDAARKDYRIQSGDLLFIQVVDEPTLAAVEKRVTSSGTISYPHIGIVEAEDRTVSEVEKEIWTRLDRDYIINPQVLVSIKEYKRQTVSVGGEVNRPGVVVLPPEQQLDIPLAIAEAGGFTRMANRDKIEFTRNGVTRRFKLEDISRVTDPTKKIWLQPGDRIYVEDKLF